MSFILYPAVSGVFVFESWFSFLFFEGMSSWRFFCFFLMLSLLHFPFSGSQEDYDPIRLGGLDWIRWGRWEVFRLFQNTLLAGCGGKEANCCYEKKLWICGYVILQPYIRVWASRLLFFFWFCMSLFSSIPYNFQRL